MNRKEWCYLFSADGVSQKIADVKQETRGGKGGGHLDLLIVKCNVSMRVLLPLHTGWLVQGVWNQLCGVVRPLVGTLSCVMQIKWFPMPGPLKHAACCITPPSSDLSFPIDPSQQPVLSHFLACLCLCTTVVAALILKYAVLVCIKSQSM